MPGLPRWPRRLWRGVFDAGANAVLSLLQIEQAERVPVRAYVVRSRGFVFRCRRTQTGFHRRATLIGIVGSAFVADCCMICSMDATALLTQVNTAIANCLTAQSYDVAGRKKVMAQLSELRKFRQELIDEISNGQSGGGMATLLSMGEPTV
jgi:hypothetical protein